MNIFDVLILGVYDMFEATVFYLVVYEDNLTEVDQANLKETKGVLNTDAMSLGFTQVLGDLDRSAEFPYEVLKSANNPKVLALIID